MNNLTFCFRINSNENMGIGHAKRCVRIAYKLKKYGYDSVFFTDKKSKLDFFLRDFEIKYVYERSSQFTNQKIDAELFLKKIKLLNPIVVTDDYRLDIIWEKIISKNKIKIVVLDDSENKKHFCDTYINYKPNFINQRKLNPDLNKKKETKLLLGPKYAIIDCRYHNNLEKKIKNNFNICFYMGGGGNFKFFDKIIINLINLFSTLKKKIQINIVQGPACKNIDKIILLSKKYKFIKIIDGKKNLDKKISKMNLVVGSAGNIIYETSYYNIPSIFFEISKNQNNSISNMEKIGHYFILNKSDLKNYLKISKLIYLLFKNYKRILKLVKKKEIFVDNKGPDRIVKSILFGKKSINKKIFNNFESKKIKFISEKVKDNEINKYLDSRNLYINRKVSFSSKKINRIDHYIWWLSSKRISHSISINNKKIMYLYDETYKINLKNYSLQGWFSTENKFGIKEVLLALNWHKKYMEKKKNIDLSFGVIKKDNLINFSKYLGWIPINKDAEEFQILKRINNISKKYNYYIRD